MRGSSRTKQPAEALRVLVVSNLDTKAPYGQTTRPLHLSRGLEAIGCAVAHVAPNTEGAGLGPNVSTRSQSLSAYRKGLTCLAKVFRPDVVYTHQNLPGFSAVTAGVGVPVVADFHSLPSLEWALVARHTAGADRSRALVQAGVTTMVEAVIAHRARRCIAAGDEVASDLARRYRRRSGIEVVPNGVPALRRHATEERSWTGTRFVATIPSSASPANLAALKFLARSAAFLHRLDSSISIHVSGTDEGPPAPNLEYHGYVDDLSRFLSHSDGALLPYPHDAELRGGARNKLLEALAFAPRVITTSEGLRGARMVADWDGVTVAGASAADFADAMFAAASGSTIDRRQRDAFYDQNRWSVLAAEVAQVLEIAAGRPPARLFE